MTVLKTRRALCAIGAGISAVAVGASAYAATSTPTASATDTVARSATSHTLPATGGSLATVLTLRLPAGKYVITAGGDFVNWGPSDYSRCRILVGSTQIAAVSTIVGSPDGAGSNGAAAFVAPFALTGGVSVGSAGATAHLQCSHDQTNGSQPYVDANASIWAHRTASLQINTE